jgi:hypothetical protein
MPPSTLSVLEPVPLPKKRAEEPLPADAVPVIADLCEKWHLLHDLDRAVAVRDIIQLGVARRRLAREMGFSEGLLRHLLKALKASPADQDLARRHAISTNELVRRSVGRSASSEQRTADVTMVVNWLRKQSLSSPQARLILGLAAQAVRIVERKYSPPLLSVPAGMTVDEVIEGCRPDRSRFDHHLGWLAHWLSIWVFPLIPETDRRRDSLNKALEHFPNGGLEALIVQDDSVVCS